MRIICFFLVTVLLFSGILVGCSDSEALFSDSIYTEAEEKNNLSDSSTDKVFDGTAVERNEDDKTNKNDNDNKVNNKSNTDDNSVLGNGNLENNLVSGDNNTSSENINDENTDDQISVFPENNDGWSPDI